MVTRLNSVEKKKRVKVMLALAVLIFVCVYIFIISSSLQMYQEGSHEEMIQAVLKEDDVQKEDEIENVWTINSNSNKEDKRELIVISIAARSKADWTNIDSTSLHKLLLPSIKRTVTPTEKQKYRIEMEVCFDTKDAFFENKEHQQHLQESHPFIPISFVSVPKKRKNKIPFNPCTRAAYDYGASYIVRLNDDTEISTEEWITKGVTTLLSYDPPNVGVVGPTCHEGNTSILTHDMVHRTHLDIFPDYYPDMFDNWYIDDWITRVYGPLRTKKLEDWVVVHHTNTHGTRYAVNTSQQRNLDLAVKRGGELIKAYVTKKQMFNEVLGSDLVTSVSGPMGIHHDEKTSSETLEEEGVLNAPSAQ